MFTGIVEELGEVVEIETAADSAVFTIRGPLVTQDATHWMVRRMADVARGGPQATFDAEGRPIVIPIETTLAQFHQILRDHGCHGSACDLGDRRAIDALIATHGVVFDATDRVLWVSRGPHLSGAFVRFDLRRVFTEGRDPAADPAPEIIEDDPILADGRYAEGRARAVRPTEKK